MNPTSSFRNIEEIPYHFPCYSFRFRHESSPRTYHVILDTETTGLIPRGNVHRLMPRIVQLAIHIPCIGVTFEEKINPEMEIPKVASAVHKIRNSDVAHARTFKAVWLSAQEFIRVQLNLQPGDVVIVVGHNLRCYDKIVIQYECERVGLCSQFRVVDTLDLVRGLFSGIVDEKLPGFFKLDALPPAMGINVDNAHDAAGDVMVNSLLFDSFVNGIDRERVYDAMTSESWLESLLHLCKTEGSFNPDVVFSRYLKACDMTIPLAKQHLNEIASTQLFEPKNFAAILDVPVNDNDPARHVLWKIFLKMTAGIDRKVMMDALDSPNPFDAVYSLNTTEVLKRLHLHLEYSMVATGITLQLGKGLFAATGTEVVHLGALANLVGMNRSGRFLTHFDEKRLFLKLTQGLQSDEVNGLLYESDPVGYLLTLIHEKGTFNPALNVPIRTKRSPPRSSSSLSGSKVQRI